MNELAALLAEIADQEARVVFESFDHSTAWRLGSAMITAAASAGHPVVVSISKGGQLLFHAALPGTVPDNDDWVARKVRVVERFGHSSFYVGTQCRLAGETFEERTGLDGRLYAAHGGCFPITVRGTGIVATVTVSGLPQAEDHRFVVEQLEAFLSL